MNNVFIGVLLLASSFLAAGCDGPRNVSVDQHADGSGNHRHGEIEIEGFVHHYANNQGVRLHYVSVGSGPLVVLLHGFPDFWYTWREQMNALKGDFRLVALDLRGYNLSDQPDGIEHYEMPRLMDDVAAVIQACGEDKATLIGHDWGGAIAWQLAIHRPELVEQLVVCNMIHPTGSSRMALRSLKENGNTSYMDTLKAKSKETLEISWMSGWVNDRTSKRLYEKAFNRSSIDGMLNYYRANTKDRHQRALWLENPEIPELPKVKAPVLAIFGLSDKYVNKEGLNNTWDWSEGDFTLVTIPNAGHFVQHDASKKVTETLKMWLLRK